MERLNEEHFKILTEESAISAEVLEAAEVYSADKDEAYRQVGVASSGILFSYVGFNKELLGRRKVSRN
jgi:hypothetical protein